MPKRARIGLDADNPLRPSPERVKATSKNVADPVRPVGVTLRESSLADLETLAQERGVSRNALMRYLLLHGIQEIKAGRLEPSTRTTTELDMPTP